MKTTKRELFWEEELRQEKRHEKMIFVVVLVGILLETFVCIIMAQQGVEDAHILGIVSIVIILGAYIATKVGKRMR